MHIYIYMCVCQIPIGQGVLAIYTIHHLNTCATATVMTRYHCWFNMDRFSS